MIDNKETYFEPHASADEAFYQDDLVKKRIQKSQFMYFYAKFTEDSMGQRGTRYTTQWFWLNPVVSSPKEVQYSIMFTFANIDVDLYDMLI